MTPERIAELEEAIGRRSCLCPECELARELIAAVIAAYRPQEGRPGRPALH